MPQGTATMEGAYIHINIPNIVSILVIGALGMFVLSAMSSLLRQYGPSKS